MAGGLDPLPLDWTVVVPRLELERALEELSRSSSAPFAWEAGLAASRRTTALLARRRAAPEVAPAPPAAARIYLLLADMRRPQAASAEPAALLRLSRDSARLASGEVWSQGSVHRLGRLLLPGAGMHRLESSSEVVSDLAGRWSRLAGAIGAEALARLQALRFAVVGVGRTGSLAATSLVRLGPRRLSLIDPDRIALHNLDAMDGVSLRDLGRSKALAVAEACRDLAEPGMAVRGFAASGSSLQALPELKACDVVCTTADRNAPRVFVALLAAAYLKVHLDVGTGVLGTGGGRRIGADVRLTLPAERCLACLGGFGAPIEGITPAEPAAVPRPPWWREKAGSLRSLNAIAVHLGIRLLEDLVAERVVESLWLRLEYDEVGLPRLSRIAPGRPHGCPVCRSSGAGDEILPEIRRRMAALGPSGQGSRSDP